MPRRRPKVGRGLQVIAALATMTLVLVSERGAAEATGTAVGAAPAADVALPPARFPYPLKRFREVDDARACTSVADFIDVFAALRTARALRFSRCERTTTPPRVRLLTTITLVDPGQADDPGRQLQLCMEAPDLATDAWRFALSLPDGKCQDAWLATLDAIRAGNAPAGDAARPALELMGAAPGLMELRSTLAAWTAP